MDSNYSSKDNDQPLGCPPALGLGTGNAHDTHLSVLPVTNLVADIHQCRGGANILDKEQGPFFNVVELQELKQH